MAILTQTRLMEYLSYDPVSGHFILIEVTSRTKYKEGEKLGSLISSGYLQVYVDGIPYLAHRLAWLYVHGEFPEYGIDHKDRDKLNNAISNLRKATRRQNIINQGIKSTNTSGFKGVYYCKQKQRYQARIRAEGMRIHLGFFSKPEDAAKAYIEAALKYHGEFYNGPPS